MEVSNDRVTILSDVAELGSQIDVERARRSAEEAEQQVRQTDDAEAEATARRAHVRLAAAGGARRLIPRRWGPGDRPRCDGA